MSAVELRLVFTDTYVEGEDNEPMEFTHTLSAPEGLEITGGQIYVENKAGTFERFSFRIDREDGDKPKFVIIEDVT